MQIQLKLENYMIYIIIVLLTGDSILSKIKFILFILFIISSHVISADTEYIITDYSGKKEGLDLVIPDWIQLTAHELEQKEEYKGYCVVPVIETGQNLEGLLFWAKGFSIPHEVASRYSRRVEREIVGFDADDSHLQDSYIRIVVRSVSEIRFSGLVIIDEYWIKYENIDEPSDFEYRLYILAIIPEAEIKDVLNNAFEFADEIPPQSESEKQMRIRIMEYLISE